MQTALSHYQTFQISDHYKIPSSLYDLLAEVWHYSYEELYEESAENTLSLEEVYIKILNAFENNKFDALHFHYLLMAMIMSQAVLPTIKAYLADDTRPQKVYQYIDNYLENKITLANSEITTIINEFFPHESEGNQAIDEALDVFKNLLRVLNFEEAKEALLNILDDCLEGYAIFPGSQGRRDLFNWWLLEVIPASWCLQFPDTVYTIKGIQQTQNNQKVEAIADLKRNIRKNHIMYEKIFNLFVFVEGDIIYELGVTIHEKDGSDEDKMSFLRQQVNSDFKKAIRFLVPNRYLLEDSSSSQTITAIKYEKFRTLMQMNLHLQVFEEIFQSFNASETPLFCLTPIVNGEPKVDKIENFQSIKKHNSEEAKSMEFRFVDYLVDYSSKDGFDMTRLLDDDYLLAIKLLYNEGHYISAVKLFLSFIDTIAYLEFGDISNNFHKWLDQYAELSNIGISSSELWEMRNSLLHMTNSDSRKILKGEVQRLMFYVGTLTHEFPDKTDEAKYVKLIDLINAVLVGVEKWAMSYNIDRSKLADFISRYDRVISDSRYETVRIN